MRRQIASELWKLTTTRSAAWLLAGLLAITAIGTIATVGDAGLARRMSLPLQRQPFLLFPLTTTTLFTVILGIRSFTDEFRHGSVVPTLLAAPDRRRVLGAKLVAVGAASTVYAVAAFGVSLAVGAGGLLLKGGDVAWSAVPLAEMTGRLIVASALWSAIGVGIGLAVRQQVTAIVGTLLWSLIAEGALATLAPDLARYLPGSASSAIVGVNAGSLLAPGIAVAVLAGWAAVASLAGDRLMRRRDIA